MTDYKLYEDAPVKRVMVEAWENPYGNVFLKEDWARLSCSDSRRCKSEKCPELVSLQGSGYCELCSYEHSKKAWHEAKKVTWDGVSPFYSERLEQFFDSYTDLEEGVKFRGIDDDITPESFLLYAVEYGDLSEVEVENLVGEGLGDLLPENVLSPDVLEKLDELNAVIRKHPKQLAYYASDVAISSFGF